MDEIRTHRHQVPAPAPGAGISVLRLLLAPVVLALVPAAHAATNGAVAPAAVLRDIRDPVHIESPLAWLWRILLILGLGALVGFLWWWRQRRTSTASTPGWTPGPDEKALTRLQKALDRIGDPERFVTEVSEIARTYLEERFGLHAPDRTTEEFLAELSGSAALDTRHKSLLEDFLTRCDLVKFARAEADRNELGDLHSAAVRLVEETRPSRASAANMPPVATPAGTQA